MQNRNGEPMSKEVAEWLIEDNAPQLYMLTTNTIEKVLLETRESGSHPVGSWMKEGDEHHAKRAWDHLMNAEGFARLSNLDLEHALTRLAMAVFNRRMGVKGDFGPDGEGNKG